MHESRHVSAVGASNSPSRSACVVHTWGTMEGLGSLMHVPSNSRCRYSLLRTCPLPTHRICLSGVSVCTHRICRVPGNARGYLAYVLGHIGDHQILPLMENAVEARTELAGSLAGNRELLYLDLALEDQIRQAAERGISGAGALGRVCVSACVCVCVCVVWSGVVCSSHLILSSRWPDGQCSLG